MPTKPKLYIERGTYLGIDPGKSGGLAVMKDSRIVHWVVMPESDRDLLNVLDGCKRAWDVAYCCLERVHSMPGEGHVGVFSFGEGYGKLQMALTATDIPYEKVTPRTWQKGVGVKAKTKQETKPAFKERLRQHAQQLFPYIELWSTPKTLGKQRAVCDAMLLAEYCNRMREGLLNGN